MTRRRILRVASITIALAAALSLALWLMLVTGEIRLPKRMVLKATVPHSPYAVELWERPDLDVTVWEYETWLVMRSTKEAHWHLIDDEYITFTDTALLFSSELNTIRVEVGKGVDAHLIAEYGLKHQTFRAESEASVRSKKGWTVLAAAHVH